MAIPVSRAPIPILMYHQVDAPPPSGAPYRSLSVAPASFARQMGLMAALGWRGLSMTGLQPYLRGEQQGRVFGITLDDGYLNNLQFALPALQRHGFTSTCYAVSGLLGDSNRWDHALGIAPKPLMTASELKTWVAAGQEVGAHGRSHSDLTTLNPTQAREEIAGSKADLEQLLGVAVNHFCYPYGRHSAEHADMARAAGYDTATTVARGRSLASDDWFELPRIPVVRSTTMPVMWLKVATGYEDRRRA
jgi:peptidoglycan/xylan/chitin deacetylase (PgdA/CDA1 family)